MKSAELFIFLVCLIVFVLLVAFFSVLITIVGKQQLKLIRSGYEDERIKKETTIKKGSKWWNVIEKVLSSLLCCFLLVALVSSIIAGYTGNNRVAKGIPAIKVVSSTSMADKYEKNEYLFENDLNDQLQILDLIVLHELPKEEDIKLYDIIVYETATGFLVIHRVIGIEEPNERHPDERWFQLKGDAAEAPDRFPVRYSQMRSIYKGERIPNIGSFVFFMQSPAGSICFILAVFAFIVMPFIDAKFQKEELKRVLVMIESGEIDVNELKNETKKAVEKENKKSLEKDARKRGENEKS